jgi:hypothetical protein
MKDLSLENVILRNRFSSSCTVQSADKHGGIYFLKDTTGTKYNYDGGEYIYIQKEATGRFFRYDIPNSAVDGLTTILYTQGTAVIGDTLFDIDYQDGATRIKYLYMILNTSTVMLRIMVI